MANPVRHDLDLAPSDDGGGVAARPGLALAATILASSLAFVDGSVVNVALPAIGRGLATGPGGLQWVVNAYLLPLSALLLLGGAADDRFGRRRMLVLGTGLFAAASAGCREAARRICSGTCEPDSIPAPAATSETGSP